MRSYDVWAEDLDEFSSDYGTCRCVCSTPSFQEATKQRNGLQSQGFAAWIEDGDWQELEEDYEALFSE